MHRFRAITPGNDHRRECTRRLAPENSSTRWFSDIRRKENFCSYFTMSINSIRRHTDTVIDSPLQTRPNVFERNAQASLSVRRHKLYRLKPEYVHYRQGRRKTACITRVLYETTFSPMRFDDVPRRERRRRRGWRYGRSSDIIYVYVLTTQ